ELDDDDVPFLRAALAEEVAEVLLCLGRCESSAFQRLANRVYRAWPAPILRMRLLREDGRWKLFDLATERVQRLEGPERDLLIRALRQPRLDAGEREERRLPSIALLYDESD